MGNGSASRQRGFTYMGLLLFVAMSGIALSVIGPVWHTEAQREREKELLFVGEQMAQAIASYHQHTPGGVKQYPASLEDLLQDKRFPTMRRHLRKLYRDPMTGSTDWGLIREQGRITGVYSRSKIKPIKQEGFADNMAAFASAGSYENWRFTASGVDGTNAAATAAPEAVANAATSTPTGEAPMAIPASTAASVPAMPSSGGNASSAPRDAYASCGTAMAAENMQCRGSCGSPAGAACRSCFAAAFEHYRACLRGG